MGTRKDQKPQGFAVVDPRWTAAKLRANDGVAGNSSYTEANPEPGQMTLADTLNLGQLEISGGQTRTVEAIAARGGAPATESVGVIWRLDGETADTDYRGWQPPNHPVWWEAISTAASVTNTSICVIEKTQQPVVLTETLVSVYNHTTSEWDRVLHAAVLGVSGIKAIMSVPNRLLVVVMQGLGGFKVFVSDDNNVSWRQTVNAVAPGAPGGVTPETGDADIDPRTGEILAVIQGDDETLHQYASRDQGATWAYVGSSVGNAGSLCQVRALPAGGFVVSIVTNLGFAVSRVVGSAFELLGNIDPVQPFGATTTAASEQRFAVWPDPDGTLWAMVESASGRGITLAYSTDNNASWTELDFGLADMRSTPDFLKEFQVVSCLSGACMLHGWESNVNGDEGRAVWWLGGWTKAEPEYGTATIEDSQGFGEHPDSVWSHTWLPFELPDDMAADWQQVGTAGVINHRLLPLNGSRVDMQITTTASTGYYQRLTGQAGGRNLLMAQFQLIQGGSLTAAEVGFGSRWADGVSDYRVRIYALSPVAGNDEFAVYDVHGATALATVTIPDWNLNSVAILMYHDANEVQVFYRLPGLQTNWVHVVSSTTVTDGGALAATSLAYFGHLASTTATSLWHSFHSAETDQPLVGLNLEPYRTGTAPTLGEPLIGRWLTAAPMPIPEVGSDDCAAFAALVRGPVLADEAMTVEPSYRNRIEYVFPTLSASPEDEWRSTDDSTDVRIALDFDRPTMVDGSWAYVLALVNTNIKNAKLEAWDGAAWQTLGTYNGSSGHEGLTYALTGDVMRPAAATAAADRFFQAGEFVNGYAILDPTGTPKVRKVVYHTGGGWSGSGVTTVKPYFRLKGIDGTELATGTVHLVSPKAMLYLFLDGTVSAHYERFSLLVEGANNVTAEGYFKIGALPFGAVTGLGQQWGRGWSRALIPNTRTRVDAHGTIRRREEGPPLRRWVASWQTGLNVRQLRQGVDQPYLSPTVSDPGLVADQDVWFQLYALLVQSKGGEVPVLACARFPATSGVTITDRTGWLYGILTGTVQANNVVGQEMEGEAMRIESLTVEELG